MLGRCESIYYTDDLNFKIFINDKATEVSPKVSQFTASKLRHIKCTPKSDFSAWR